MKYQSVLRETDGATKGSTFKATLTTHLFSLLTLTPDVRLKLVCVYVCMPSDLFLSSPSYLNI